MQRRKEKYFNTRILTILQQLHRTGMKIKY